MYKKTKTKKSVRKIFQKIDLNDLPQYSSWPAKLCGVSEWKQPTRNKKFILREYNQKWGSLLKKCRNKKFSNLNETIEYIFKTHFPENFLLHIKENIYYSKNNSDLWDFCYNKIKSVLVKYINSNGTIVELGSGWGRNLFCFLKYGICKNVIGGEYNQNGVMLGKVISKKFDLPAEFFSFDYHNMGKAFMKKLNNNVVFTHNSIEQIAHVTEKMILSIANNNPKAVIHFEPIYEYRNKNSILHYLWKRYTELNDYNRNLLTVLKDLEKKGYIKIVAEHIHALGLNAFNPGSFVVWVPTKKAR